MIALCLTLTVAIAYADEPYTDGDWVYTIDRNGFAVLSGYVGEETSLVLPEKLGEYQITIVGNKAFQGNTTIKEIEIPDCYTTIGHRAFENCTRLQNLVLGKGITNWTEDWDYNGAFAGCVNLFSVEFSSGITSIGPYAFKDCTLLDMVVLPDTVSIIYENAFENCELLDIAEVYGDIGNSAFKNCSWCIRILWMYWNKECLSEQQYQ